MSSNGEVLFDEGRDWTLKVARVVPEAICYGTCQRFQEPLYMTQVNDAEYRDLSGVNDSACWHLMVSSS
jgi:hypothetical protein